MTQIAYRANLTAAELPMLSDFQGRSVIVSEQDQNFSRQLVSSRNKDKDIGIPQAYYGHNIVPTDAGFLSVGYKQVAGPPGNGDETFGDILLIFDTNNNTAFFCASSAGNCYVLPGTSYSWIQTTSVSPGTGGIVTAANVNGQSYIYFGFTGCYTYDFASNTLVSKTLISLDPAQIIGIVSSSGYLLAWTATDLNWCSSINPLDFTPSIITGAGGGGVQGLKGNIVVCLQHSFGLIIYTQRNCVGATYTTNAQYPFSYLEIIGGGGLTSWSKVAYDANSTDHYAYTTVGLQTISIQSAQVLFPWVTDFLGGRVFEDFNESTLEFTNQVLTNDLLVKVTTVADRYLVISYGILSYTHAIVYDVGLERYGKFKIDHVDCFEYFYLADAVQENPKKGIGFCQADGTIYVADIDYSTVGTSGVLLLGKYQYSRANYITLLDVQLENIRAGNTFNCTILTSIDGKNNKIANFITVPQEGELRKYQGRSTGINHSLVLTGAFHISSLQLKFIEAGSTN